MPQLRQEQATSTAAKVMSSRSIETGASGVLGSHAVISQPAAAVLVRLLGDWRRGVVHIGIPPNRVREVELAIDALRAAGAELSPGANGKGQSKSEASESESWLTTDEVATAIDRTPQRVRQLVAEGRIEGQLVNGRMQYPPGTVKRARSLTSNR